MPNRTWLDQAIEWVSPRWGMKRAQYRSAADIMLSYEGARTDRRASGWITNDSAANTEIATALTFLRQRSRDLIRNNAYATNALDELSGQCVGAGIRARAKSVKKNKTLNAQINEAWKRWVDECDADNQLDFYGLQDLMVRQVVEAGECLVRLRLRKPDDGLYIPMQIQIIEPDYLDQNKSEVLKNGGRIIQGIEFDPIGRRVAYWIFPEHPGDNMFNWRTSNSGSYRVPASDVLHVYRKKRAQQARGVPWLAPVIISLRDMDEYMEAELVRKKIEACFSAFVTQQEGPDIAPIGSTVTNDSGQLEETLEPGLIKYLKPGEEIDFASPSGHGEAYKDFMFDLQTRAAVGIGLTYEQFTGDQSRVNYSSHKSGLLSFRTKMDQFRWLCLVPMALRPIRSWFIGWAFAAGRISQLEYTTEWAMPGFGSIDPLKDAKADQVQIRNGVRTWAQVVGEQGYDAEEQVEEIRQANELWDGAEVVLDCDPRTRTLSGSAIGSSNSSGQSDEPPSSGKEGDEEEDDNG